MQHGDDDDGGGDAPACSICQETLLVREHLPAGGGTVSITECGHYFHTACLRAWYARNPARACPDCRFEDGAVFEAGDGAAAPPAALPHLARLVGHTAPLYAAADSAKAAGAVVVAGDDGALYGAEPQAAGGGDPSPAVHPLIAADMSMDELCEQRYTDPEVATMEIGWRDAVRLGLRKDHFESGWLALARATVLFRDASWDALRRDLGYTLADAVPPDAAGAAAASERGLSAHALGRLGATAASLRASGELTRELVLALPFSLSEWVDELRLTRADLDALGVRAVDYVALARTAGRGWTSKLMMSELHFERRTLIDYKVVRDYSHIELKI